MSTTVNRLMIGFGTLFPTHVALIPLLDFLQVLVYVDFKIFLNLKYSKKIKNKACEQIIDKK